MTKPWEEEWDDRTHDSIKYRLCITGGDAAAQGRVTFAESPLGREDEGDSARFRLAAWAPEMARMLLKREWSGAGTTCYECFAFAPRNEEEARRDHGHAHDCAWLYLMRQAGLRE